MAVPMSEVLAVILARAETTSSIMNGLDDALRYGDINRIEHETAHAMIKRFLRDNGEELINQTFQVKRQAFKQFIKETKANESFRVR